MCVYYIASFVQVFRVDTRSGACSKVSIIIFCVVTWVV